MYDKLLYDISLRTLHELFEADAINAIDSIVFNGWVTTVNKATGKNENISRMQQFGWGADSCIFR